MAPSISVGPRYGMAQATHGSAPDIAGRGVANPYAMIMSVQMLLRWLGRKRADAALLKAADVIETVVAEALEGGTALTEDLGGTASTQAMGGDIVARISGAGVHA